MKIGSKDDIPVIFVSNLGLIFADFDEILLVLSTARTHAGITAVGVEIMFIRGVHLFRILGIRGQQEGVNKDEFAD